MSRPCKLLVEGRDDQHAIWALAKYYQIPEVFDVEIMDGVDTLLESLPLQLRASDLDRIGVIVDADSDLLARWQALSNILMRDGYKVPKQPANGGTILEQEEKPVVGIWLMPDNCLPGMLENFVSTMIPVGDPLWPHAQGCVDQIPASQRRFPTEHDIKAKLHTWLAWQAEPGKPIGTAITARYLDPNSPGAGTFIDWILRLFDIQ